MKHFFVIGNQASKSLSPLIFNYWFKKYNLKAKYSFIEASLESFDKKIKEKLNDNNTKGINVTVPFKENILKHLNTKNIHAEKIRAVNCLTVGKKIKGINTDWIGYLSSIKNEKIKKNNKILILGFGGASRAIYYGLILKGYTNVIVFNRSKKSIKINGNYKFTKKYSLINQHLTKADLIINTTPINPLTKKQITLIRHTTIISDIVYQPKNTPFLQKFEINKKIYGISMLLEQALPCFKQWFGFTPEIDKTLIKKLNNKIK